METKNLKHKKPNELPYNYSLYPVKHFSTEEITQKSEARPIEYCKVYKAKLFVKQPYKKIIEY